MNKFVNRFFDLVVRSARKSQMKDTEYECGVCYCGCMTINGRCLNAIHSPWLYERVLVNKSRFPLGIEEIKNAMKIPGYEYCPKCGYRMSTKAIHDTFRLVECERCNYWETKDNLNVADIDIAPLVCKTAQQIINDKLGEKMKYKTRRPITLSSNDRKLIDIPTGTVFSNEGMSGKALFIMDEYPCGILLNEDFLINNSHYFEKVKQKVIKTAYANLYKTNAGFLEVGIPCEDKSIVVAHRYYESAGREYIKIISFTYETEE